MAVIDGELLVVGFIYCADANRVDREEPEFLHFQQRGGVAQGNRRGFTTLHRALFMRADLHFPDNDQQAYAGAAGQPENHVLVDAVELACREGANSRANAAKHSGATKLKTGSAADFINVSFANTAACAVGHANINTAGQRPEKYVNF